MSEINIHSLKKDNNRIINELSVSPTLNDFIKSSKLFVEYDVNIDAHESILNIPLVATVLPLAWLSGSDISVDTLDKNFCVSCNNLGSYFKKQFPLSPFTTKIKVGKLTNNTSIPEDSENRPGLLFSGGIDSMHSFISNLHLHPLLIMHWGIERTPYPMHRKYWENVVATYQDFANKHDSKLYVTKSNALEILHERRIEHKYSKELFYGSLWERLQLSLVVLGLVAPLSINRFNKLLIAGSAWPNSIETASSYRPYSARPEVDEKISWANLTVTHDGFIEKHKKILELADYMKKNNLIFRVCLNRDDKSGELNCSKCKKCSRSIAQLIQAEINPNDCGFKVFDDSQLNTYKEELKKHGLVSFGVSAKNNLPEFIDFDLYGSKKFLEWLRNFDVPEKEQDLFFKDLYNGLPFPLAKLLNEFFKLVGINIHFGNPKLSSDRVNELVKE